MWKTSPILALVPLSQILTLFSIDKIYLTDVSLNASARSELKPV